MDEPKRQQLAAILADEKSFTRGNLRKLGISDDLLSWAFGYEHNANIHTDKTEILYAVLKTLVNSTELLSDEGKQQLVTAFLMPGF